jgi:hypothetical protein
MVRKPPATEHSASKAQLSAAQGRSWKVTTPTMKNSAPSAIAPPSA